MIWTYWEQGIEQAPPWIRLCRETITTHAGDHEVHTLDAETIGRFLPDLRPELWQLPTIATRADHLRVRLLERYGGLWLDLDVIAFPSLTDVFHCLDHAEFACAGKRSNDVTMGFMAARPGAEVLQCWRERQEQLLSVGPPAHLDAWGALGGPLMGAEARRIGVHDVGDERVVPIPWREWRRFLSPFESATAILNAEPFVVYLFHQEMSERMLGFERRDLLGGRRLISRLFRASLSIENGPLGDVALECLSPASALWWKSRAWARSRRRSLNS